MNYPIVIHKDKDSDYGVTVPDLPGCYSAGSTIDEALTMAREAIELHLEGMIDDGQVIPAPGNIEKHKANRDYAGGVWAFVTVDPSTLRVKTKRINVTIPERVLDVVDQHAARIGETRSGLLVQAVAEYIGRGGDKALAKAQPGRKPTPKLMLVAAKSVTPSEGVTSVRVAAKSASKHGAKTIISPKGKRK